MGLAGRERVLGGEGAMGGDGSRDRAAEEMGREAVACREWGTFGS